VAAEAGGDIKNSPVEASSNERRGQRAATDNKPSQLVNLQAQVFSRTRLDNWRLKYVAAP
jgi:hypothetical protein